MLLADLRLEEIPTPALLAIKQAIIDVIHGRKKQAFIASRIEHSQQIPRHHFRDEPFFEDSTTRTLKAIPPSARTPMAGFTLRYLPPLLTQNWYDLFQDADDEIKRFYVYTHIDPRKKKIALDPFDIVLPGTPFYIGKGTGQRAYDLKRNDGHRKILSEIRTAGFPDTLIPHILKKRLTEKKALALEAKLIYFFGSTYDPFEKKGCLINLSDHIRPKFQGEMPRILPPHPLQKQPEPSWPDR